MWIHNGVQTNTRFVKYQLFLIGYPITQSPLWLMQSMRLVLSDNIIEIRWFKLWVALRLVLSSNSKRVLWGPVSLLALDWHPGQGVCLFSTHAPAPHDPEY